MSTCFIDYPHYVSPEEYTVAITAMVERIKKLDGIVSIYQIGSISSPGISDIDIVAVFNDGISCKIDPRATLSKRELYLFTHGIFGISESHFNISKKYTFFHNFKLLWGKETSGYHKLLDNHSISALKTQTALEYLLEMFITLSCQESYGIYKVRSILLQTKALVYDFEFLGIKEHYVLDLVHEFIHLRNSWFNEGSEHTGFHKLLTEFRRELQIFLKELLCEREFYVNQTKPLFQLSNNIFVKKSVHFKCVHRGFVLPQFFGFLGRKYFNLQNRCNQFTFHLPMENNTTPDILVKYFSYINSIKAYNQKHIDDFMSLSSSLGI